MIFKTSNTLQNYLGVIEVVVVVKVVVPQLFGRLFGVVDVVVVLGLGEVVVASAVVVDL